MSRFKAKEVRCPACGTVNLRHEEKETDVAIAAKLLELFVTDECDSTVLVTGDTDVAPAVRAAARLFPITKEAYAKYQLPDPVVLPDQTHLNKPAAW